ncbi:DUF2188 domain-containing protein [Candidatus Peregrinibacteria bacterium]|nr:DUF2188 domain-containing protein [Candidatus Peregrinibacteria bacterium]
MKKVFLSSVKAQDLWKVQTSGARKAAGLFDTKAEALKRAIELAKNQNAELIVKKEDGTFQYRNPYGHDPFPPRG